jgi:hypothetical protein
MVFKIAAEFLKEPVKRQQHAAEGRPLLTTTLLVRDRPLVPVPCAAGNDAASVCIE